MPSSRGPSPPRDRTHIFCISCTADGFTTTEPPGKPLIISLLIVIICGCIPQSKMELLITQSHASSNFSISDNSSIFSSCLREKPLESSPPLPLPNTCPVHQQILLIPRLQCLQIPATPHFLHQHLILEHRCPENLTELPTRGPLLFFAGHGPWHVGSSSLTKD